MGGSERPPSPPALGHAPAKPWRASGVLCGLGTPESAKAVSWADSSRPGGAGALFVMAGLLEDRLELELAADRPVGLHRLEAGHRVVVDVTVLVEAPLAVDALEVLGRRDRLADGFALLGDVLGLLDLRRGALDRVHDHPAAFRGVERVRGRLLAVLRLVGLVGLGADAAHLLEGQAGERDAHAGRQHRVARGALEEPFLEKAVGPQEARARGDEADILHLPG